MSPKSTCTDPMCACRGGPCAECPDSQCACSANSERECEVCARQRTWGAPAPGESYEDLMNALHSINTAAVALPGFEVRHEGGLGAVVRNIVDTITHCATQAPAPAPDPNNPGWCIGCNPDNCEGCGNGLPPPSPAVAHGWRPIETAPMDGTTIVLRRGQRVYSGRWGRGTYNTGWLSHDSDIVFAFSPLNPPTHWMPLDSDAPVQHKEQP